jgi:hypothetical protein
MKPIQISALLLVLFGFVLHTYTELVEASSFTVGFWLWSLSPYIVGGLLLVLARQPHAATGALVLPVIMDSITFYSVFVAPGGSTAALGLLFVPLWNLVIFVPLGGTVGWWVGKRLRENAL